MPDVMRFVKDIFDGRESFRVYSSSGINQGDMAQWDATSRYATTNALASGSIFLGITMERNPVASLGTADAPLTGGRIRIKSAGIFNLVTTNGETYNHMDPVYQGANQRTVTLTSANRFVGRVHLPDGTQVSGTGSNTVTVSIYGSLTNAGRAPSSAPADR